MPIYTDIQFIGASINTDPVQKKYLGNMNVDADMEMRLDIMKDAVELAHENASRFDTCLKVFMAPEFYWRNPDGGYPPDTLKKLEDKLISDIASRNQYYDWLFIFGTVVIGDRREREVVITNNAIVIEGGINGRCFRLWKEAMSTCDFASDSADGEMRKTIVEKKHAEGLYAGDIHARLRHRNSVNAVENDALRDGRIIAEGGCIFTSKGVRFGLEICLDHADERLKIHIERNFKPGDIYPQVILIPSSHMDIMESSIPESIRHVFAFNVDGYRSKRIAEYNNNLVSYKYNNKKYKTCECPVGALEYRMGKLFGGKSVAMEKIVPLSFDLGVRRGDHQEKRYIITGLVGCLKAITPLYGLEVSAQNEKVAAYRMFVDRITYADSEDEAKSLLVKLLVMLLVNKSERFPRKITRSFQIICNYIKSTEGEGLAKLFAYFKLPHVNDAGLKSLKADDLYSDVSELHQKLHQKTALTGKLGIDRWNEVVGFDTTRNALKHAPTKEVKKRFQAFVRDAKANQTPFREDVPGKVVVLAPVRIPPRQTKNP